MPARVVTIHAGHPKPCPLGADGVASVEDLLALPHRYDVVLLDLPAKQAGEALLRLRMHPAYRYGPIYCCNEQDALCIALGDGQAPVDHGALDSVVEGWAERFGRLDAELLDSCLDTRILSWLWLLPNRRVHPVLNAQRPTLYEYPLLEVLDPGGVVNQFVRLQLLGQRGWIARTDCVDRLRYCVGCGSGRLNYIDVCPECHSISIARRASLRCLSCDYVGAQEHFIHDGTLECFNCHAPLSRLGQDYERPMENFGCRNCNAFFTEAEVQARCLDCGRIHQPSELRIHEIGRYKLTEIGRMHCRRGEAATVDTGEYFDALGLLGNDLFMHTLDWLLDMQRRYGQPGFSLVGLRFERLQEAVAALGEQQGYALVDEVVTRLVEIVRDTDRCTRTHEDLLWILLPQTNAEGMAKVMDRIRRLSVLIAETAGMVELRMAGCVAPNDIAEGESAALLMARVARELT